MSEFHIIFLDIPYNIHHPKKCMFKKYFDHYQSSDWENGASFIFIDNLSLEYSLVISEYRGYGFNLIYSSPNINCYSLGDKNQLNDFVENSCQIIMPKGTYISSQKAWLATEDFLDNPLSPSAKIEWVTDKDIGWDKILL